MEENRVSFQVCKLGRITSHADPRGLCDASGRSKSLESSVVTEEGPQIQRLKVTETEMRHRET
jgi:hypothetical protein